MADNMTFTHIAAMRRKHTILRHKLYRT